MNIGDKMLVKFNVKNYRNFKDEIIIDFTKKHDYKFNENCIKDNLLNKIIIFGNNSVGKSNLGYALFDIVGTLTDKNIDNEQLSNFLNADSNSLTADFFYEFKFNEDIIQYNYKKSSFKKITFEELYINDKKIYEYDFEKKEIKDYENLDLIGASTLNFEYYESNMPVFRYIANNTIQNENSIVKKLMNFVTKMLWFRSLRDNKFIGFENSAINITDWLINNNLINELNVFLNENIGVNLNIATAKLIDIKNANILVEKHKNKSLIFENVASSGTHSLLLYFYWYKHFKDVTFLFIDEFDAFYHFELSKNIIKSIISYDNMQTILTSHNTNLATNELLRPDCYFILENGKLKSFVDSTSRELREGHNLEKMLKQGEFNE